MKVIDPRIVFCDNEEGINRRDWFWPGTNDFRDIQIDARKTLGILLDEANCSVENESEITSMTFENYLTGVYTVNFEVVKFDALGPQFFGWKRDEIIKEFAQAGLRPAFIKELMVFAGKFGNIIRDDPLIALGSSNEGFIHFQHESKAICRWLWDTLLSKMNNVLPGYPCFEKVDGLKNRLKISTGEDGWKPSCLFLAVHVKKM